MPQRRHALKAIAVWGSTAALQLRPAWAQSNAKPATPDAALTAPAQAWRVMSRLGYGPSRKLIRSVEDAGSPRAWALQQLALARTASQSAPRLPPELAGMNDPLPKLFSSFQRERQARAAGQERLQKSQNNEMGAGSKAGDLTSSTDPDHFSRAMVQRAAAWRITSCSQSDQENPLLARMTEFWFNHLNVFAGKGPVRPFVGHYLINVARAHALGRFEDLLLASARHPAMLHYLDQAQSVAEGSNGPQGKARGLNENYARELMELHTLGVNGGYSQNDVRELARVLTGWTVGPQNADGFRFVERLHDKSQKTVLGQRFGGSSRDGEQEGLDAIRMLARHPSTAKRISLRLAQFFIADKPADELVQSLSRTFLDTGGDMLAVMRSLVTSADFWNPNNRLFKTPLDYACSALAATHERIAVDDPQDRRTLLLTHGFLGNAGQPINGWQTPDGYPTDAATWLVPEALTRRADFALALGRHSGDLAFLTPFLSPSTRESIAKEKPALRAGLVLASPDFMYK